MQVVKEISSLIYDLSLLFCHITAFCKLCEPVYALQPTGPDLVATLNAKILTLQFAQVLVLCFSKLYSTYCCKMDKNNESKV